MCLDKKQRAGLDKTIARFNAEYCAVAYEERERSERGRLPIEREQKRRDDRTGKSDGKWLAWLVLFGRCWTKPMPPQCPNWLILFFVPSSSCFELLRFMTLAGRIDGPKRAKNERKESKGRWGVPAKSAPSSPSLASLATAGWFFALSRAGGSRRQERLRGQQRDKAKHGRLARPLRQAQSGGQRATLLCNYSTMTEKICPTLSLSHSKKLAHYSYCVHSTDCHQERQKGSQEMEQR